MNVVRIKCPKCSVLLEVRNSKNEDVKSIKCPKCGQPIYKNTTEVFTSYPCQYEYRCLKCGWHDYAYH